MARSRIKENKLKIVIFTILLTFIWGSFIYSKSTSYICSKNPEKCGCETPLERFCDFYGNDCSDKYTSNFRKKTQAEINIDDCNDNPREDDLCKCEEYSEPRYNYTSIKLKSGEVVKSSATMCSQDDLEESRKNGYEIEFINTTSCIKSRPKTECEKGNPDWVEEKIYEEKIKIIPNKSEIVDLPEFNSIQKIFGLEICAENNTIQLQSCIPLSDGFEIVGKSCSVRNLTYCSKRYGVIYNKTQIHKEIICREKTEVEKLMDKDCEQLQLEITHCYTLERARNVQMCYLDYFDNLKRAWRQKECQI